MIKNKLRQNLANALLKLGIKDEEVDLEHPVNPAFGDYATSIALKLAKKLKKNPLFVAKDIVKNFSKNNIIEKIEVVKPGFINFWLTNKVLIDQAWKINNEGGNYGKLNFLKNQKVMIEFTDPNPFKELHIGHLYSNIVGGSLARLYEVMGAKVVRANYQGDVGMHVAKSIWGMLEIITKENLSIGDLEKKSLIEKVRFLGRAYALGNQAFEKNAKAKEEITSLNKKIYDLDPSIKDLYQRGRQWSLDYFETIYKRLGTKFDFYYFEREAGKKGLEFVRENLKKGIFKKSDNTVIFPGKKYGLHTRVFINSLGLPTYEAKDLGLASTKYQDFPYDLSLIITGNEVNEYFKVVLKALDLINPELRVKTRHLSHGMVRLPGGKISSRTGDIVTAEWLMNEAYIKALKKIKENVGEKNENKEKASIAEKVGLGAIKYALLKSSIGKDVEFDFDESINFEGNSGPYLQYTYVRTRGILRNVHSIENFIIKEKAPEEESILRTLYLFPEVVEKATFNFSPNYIASYLFDLAQKYNLFYQKYPILKAAKDIRNFRLLLTKATGQVIKNGLYLLGIETVERM